jgi:menaquinol-cytochrome c reductase iron-sulfur subunit
VLTGVRGRGILVRMSHGTPPPKTPRRGALKFITGWLSAALGAVVTLPGLAFLAHPLRKDTVRGGKMPLRVASLGQLKPGKPMRCEVRGELADAWSRTPDVKLGSCWLVKSDTDGKVRAFSTVCPHLGCGVDWDQGQNRFVCPCHDSFFSPDGKTLAGPSPRGMDELDVVADAADVKVVYRRFRVGLPKKVEV